MPVRHPPGLTSQRLLSFMGWTAVRTTRCGRFAGCSSRSGPVETRAIAVPASRPRPVLPVQRCAVSWSSGPGRHEPSRVSAGRRTSADQAISSGLSGSLAKPMPARRGNGRKVRGRRRQRGPGRSGTPAPAGPSPPWSGAALRATRRAGTHPARPDGLYRGTQDDATGQFPGQRLEQCPEQRRGQCPEQRRGQCPEQANTRPGRAPQAPAEGLRTPAAQAPRARRCRPRWP